MTFEPSSGLDNIPPRQPIRLLFRQHSILHRNDQNKGIGKGNQQGIAIEPPRTHNHMISLTTRFVVRVRSFELHFASGASRHVYGRTCERSVSSNVYRGYRCLFGISTQL